MSTVAEEIRKLADLPALEDFVKVTTDFINPSMSKENRILLIPGLVTCYAKGLTCTEAKNWFRDHVFKDKESKAIEIGLLP
jgi:hypothetical protein